MTTRCYYEYFYDGMRASRKLNYVPTTSDAVVASRTSRIACLSRFTASSTRSSLNKLNEALTYDVFLPLGRKTVPGSANTPRSSAFVRMMVSESPSSCVFGLLEFNLNLQRPHDRPLCQPSLLTGPFGDSPEKHPCFGRCPYCKTREMGSHRTFENISLHPIESGHVVCMFLESVVAP